MYTSQFDQMVGSTFELSTFTHFLTCLHYQWSQYSTEMLWTILSTVSLWWLRMTWTSTGYFHDTWILSFLRTSTKRVIHYTLPLWTDWMWRRVLSEYNYTHACVSTCTGAIPWSLSHLQCYITCGTPKWKGGWHGRSDHLHIRLTKDGWGGLLCTLTPHENKFRTFQAVNFSDKSSSFTRSVYTVSLAAIQWEVESSLRTWTPPSICLPSVYLTQCTWPDLPGHPPSPLYCHTASV